MNLAPAELFSFDISRTPFSRRGSYISLGREPDGTLLIRSVRRRSGQERLLLVRFQDGGEVVPVEMRSTPAALQITSDRGTARICLRGANELLVESLGLNFSIEMAPAQTGFAYCDSVDHCGMVSLSSSLWLDFNLIGGELEADLDWILKNNTYQGQPAALKVRCMSTAALLRIDIRPSEHKDVMTPACFEEEVNAAHVEWAQFRSKMPAVPEEFQDSAQLAWYNLWSCFVQAEGNFKYDAVLMSKASMAAIWPWDHCFNALALAGIDEKAAIEQFLLPFEIQSESGVLPDAIQADSKFDMVTKAPIHGWCLDLLLSKQSLSPEMARHVFDRLSRWTLWWFAYRDPDKDGIPHYLHGWDGWDNATVFDAGPGVETPDLSAYLVLQMRSLSRLAVQLNDESAARFWSGAADNLLQRFCDHSWDHDRFVSRLSTTHEIDPCAHSLMDLMPLVLGDLLPADKFNALTHRLIEDFLTDFGIATEMPTSANYIPDGYWRGPIWAPIVYLLVDGLRRGGKTELAADIARRFCRTVHRAAGNYENFDALTGVGLREQGYSWTAAVYLLLLNEYVLPASRIPEGQRPIGNPSLPDPNVTAIVCGVSQ